MIFGNIIVNAPSDELASQVAYTVRRSHTNVSRVWLGNVPRLYPYIINVGVSREAKAWIRHSRYGNVIKAEGPTDELIHSIIPHEVAHAAIATQFNFKTPKWFGEGVAVSQERDGLSRLRGECSKRPFMNLFTLDEYPKDWRPYYGQCFSVTNYLVERFGRFSTLEFVRQGISRGVGYTASCRDVFQTTLEELYYGWREWHNGRKRFHGVFAKQGRKSRHQMDGSRRRIAY